VYAVDTAEALYAEECEENRPPACNLNKATVSRDLTALELPMPGSLELILNPLLTTVITGAVAIVALQPLGGWISDAIAHGAS
ncbi:hypothetical protein MJM95_31740, partial [Salmonella enterica subsp. enterica serovar Anatum]|nr:hypothetical protein [Salmonella enterica subsp. enterica serovar Anatum]